MSTAKRSQFAGAPGSATAAHVVPPFVERAKPLLPAANTSAFAPPAGCMARSHVTTLRRCAHVTPPSVDSYAPPVVAASRWLPFAGSTIKSKKARPTNGAWACTVHVAPPSTERNTPAPKRRYQLPSPVPQ